MTEYAIRDATVDDLEFFAANMRQADKDEAVAQTGMHPSMALGMAFGISDYCKVGTADGVPVCIFGVSDVGGLCESIGSPWLNGTDELPKHARAFARRNIPVVEAMNERYHRLINYVDARNKMAIRWLKWLGFDIMEPVNYGPYQMMFHPFERVRG